MQKWVGLWARLIYTKRGDIVLLMINFEKKVLDNGLRAILAPMNNTEAVTLLVLVGVGSRYETKKSTAFRIFGAYVFQRAPEAGRSRGKFLENWTR